MSKPTTRRVGRPSEDYHREFAERAHDMAQAGMTDFEMAREFNINIRTLYMWRQKDPAFDAACRIGKGLADERVIASLQRMATGYDYEEQQAIKVKRGENLEDVEVVTVAKHQPANPASAMFWLKNRQRELWSDQQQVAVTVEAPTDITQLALALLATLQAGIAEAPKTIEHEDSDD